MRFIKMMMHGRNDLKKFNEDMKELKNYIGK